MKRSTHTHAHRAAVRMRILALVLLCGLALWCADTPAQLGLKQVTTEASRRGALAAPTATQEAATGTQENGTQPGSGAQPGTGAQPGAGTQPNDDPQPEDVVRKPSVELVCEDEGTREGSALYARDDLALVVRITGYELDCDRTTVMGQPLAQVLAEDKDARWEVVQDEESGCTICTGALLLSEGSYEVVGLCEAWQKDEASAQARLTYSDVELTALVVDKSAPVVTRCTVSAEPTQCRTFEEGEIAFFGAPLELAFELEDAAGVRSATLAYDDGTKRALTLAHKNTTATARVDKGTFESATTLKVCDLAGNETEWSLRAEGARHTAAGSAPCENEPLRVATTDAVVGQQGHPHRLVIDATAPRVTIEGVEEGAWSSGSVELRVRVEDDSLGYVALAEPDRTVATVTKDGTVVATVPAAFEDATTQDTSHVYALTLPARATHEDDGAYGVEAALEDLAHNASAAEQVRFHIDTTAPTLSVAFDDADEPMPGGLYAHERTARLRVCDASLSTELLCSSASPLVVEVAACAGRAAEDVGVSAWQAEPASAHTFACTVSFPANGTYDLHVRGRDAAGNVLVGAPGTSVSAEGTYDAERFIIDTEQPRMELAYAAQAPSPHTFKGTDYFKDPVAVVLTLTDRNPDLDRTCVTNADEPLDLAWEVGERDEDGKVVCTATFVLTEGASGNGAGTKQLAAHTTDRAGNASSTSLAPFVVDQTAPCVEHVALNVSPTATGVGNAAGEATLFFAAHVQNEPQLTFTCSDEYAVDAAWLTDPEGVYQNQAERLRGSSVGTFSVALLDRAQRKDDRNTAFRQNVLLQVRDMAGNVCTWSMEKGNGQENEPLAGDVGHPRELVYDATSPTVSLAGAEAGAYTQEPVTVQVDVHERNMDYLRRFDPRRVVATVHRVAGDAAAAHTSEDLAVVELEPHEAGYRATRTLDADGHYAVKAQLTDFAGNASETVELSTFTVDATPPRIAVSWDHSDARNTNYYNRARTATVTVHEHNFDAALVSLQTTGQVSAWTSDGDDHSCTVAFANASTAAAPHTLAIQARDKAGNEAAPVTEESFVLDTTKPRVSFAKRASDDDPYVAAPRESELLDGSAFAGAFEPLVLLEDEEALDAHTVEVSLVGKRAGTASAPSFAEHREERSATSYEVRWDNLGLVAADEPSYEVAADDVYVLRAQVCDKAGNVSDVHTVSFSLNRYGSNFFVESVGDAEQGQDGAWPDALLTTPPRIVIREVNVSGAASELEGDGQAAHTVTKEHARATREIARVEAEGTSGYVLESSTSHSERNPYKGWSSYTYVIAPGNFGAGSDCDFGDGGQGRYRVNVRSVDKAHNSNTTNSYWSSDEARAQSALSKDASVSFTLDEQGPRIQDAALPAPWSVGTGFEASFYLEDHITNGDYVRVLVDGAPVRVWWTESGEELRADTRVTHEGRLSFEVPARPALVPRRIEVCVADYTDTPERTATLERHGFVHTTLALEGGVLLAVVAMAAGIHRAMKVLHPAAPAKRREEEHGRTN